MPIKTAIPPKPTHRRDGQNSALDYDPTTGLLFWRLSRRRIAACEQTGFAGKPAGCRDGQYGYLTIRLYQLCVSGASPDLAARHGEYRPADILDLC